MARFGKAPGMRNMATLGMMDEIRHAQIQLFFPHELCSKDRQFDWAHKAFDTNEWGIIAARHIFDDMFTTRGAAEVALMLTFAFETGFTNMQFLGLAADAAEVGDWTFSSLISSIQTDESRHAQIGGPLVTVLVENGRKDGGAAPRRRRHLAGVAPVLRADRADHGLLHAARTPEAVVQGVHAGVDRRPVRALAARPRPRPALVLGRVHGPDRDPAPRPAPRRVVLAPDGVVEPRCGRVAGGTRLARGEVPGLERQLGEVLGRDHRQPARRPHRADLPRDAAGGLQHVPAADQHHARAGVEGPRLLARPTRAAPTTSAPTRAAGASRSSRPGTPATCRSSTGSSPG